LVRSPEACENISRSKQEFWDSKEGEKAKEILSESKSGLCYLLDEGYSERKSKAAYQAHVDDPTLADRKSESHLGVLLGDEHLEAIRKGKQELFESEEGERLREHFRGIRTGLYFDDEWRKNMSEARLKYWDSKEGLAEKERMSSRPPEEHPRWKGGFAGGYGFGWSALRDIILARDDSTYQGCG